jgi:hypothetical protein
LASFDDPNRIVAASQTRLKIAEIGRDYASRDLILLRMQRHPTSLGDGRAERC